MRTFKKKGHVEITMPMRHGIAVHGGDAGPDAVRWRAFKTHATKCQEDVA